MYSMSSTLHLSPTSSTNIASSLRIYRNHSFSMSYREELHDTDEKWNQGTTLSEGTI